MGRIKVVKASAGSGKTYRLAYEYVRTVITNPDLYKHILAVTFTNKATEEMKSRIIKEINDLANGMDQNGKLPAFLDELREETGFTANLIKERARLSRTKILHDYSHFSIMTIDKFFQRIIHSFIRELGIENDVSLEIKTEGILSKATDNMIENSINDGNLRKWLIEFVDERIEDNKKWDFKKELNNLGKEVFTDEFKNLYLPKPKNELDSFLKDINIELNTFTGKNKKLAKKAIAIINQNGLTPEDFAYGKKGFINYFYETARGKINLSYGKRVTDALNSDEKWYSKTCRNKSIVISVIPDLKPILAELCENYDVHHKRINTILLIKENFRIFALLADLSHNIRKICKENNMLLISDINRIINDMIKNNDTPFIFEKTGNNFSHYMIDEFQDTSKMQWENFVPLLQNAISQEKESPALLVGDVKQSIYRWRGGNWDILGGGIEKVFPNSDHMNLEKNYRSKKNIINFNNSLIEKIAELDNNNLNVLLEEARKEGNLTEGTKRELTDLTKKAYENCTQQVPNKENSNNGFIRIIEYEKIDENEFNEDLFIEHIEEIQSRGYKAKDIAVIVRYNYEAVEIARILLNKKKEQNNNSYCYDVVTQQALIIGNSPVAQFIIACLRISVNINRKISIAIYNKYLGNEIHSGITDTDNDFFERITKVSIEEAFEYIIAQYKLGEDPGNIAYIQALHDQILHYTSSKTSDIILFLNWWDEHGYSESINLPQGQNAITVITIHKAKGLQYPVVILPFATWEMDPNNKSIMWGTTEYFPSLGNFPLKFKKTVSNSLFADNYYKELVYSHIDNINLLYVAVTRPEDELYVMMQTPSERKQSKINNLIKEVLGFREEKNRFGELEIVFFPGEGYKAYDLGERGINVQPSSVVSNNINIYPSNKFKGQLRIKRISEKFEENGIDISSRSYGVIMHKIFESIKTKEDIPEVLKKLRSDGDLSVDDILPVTKKINNAFSNEMVNSWFEGDKWDDIKVENAILIPSKTYKMKIPDRVMIKGNKAVVVDYKFGHKTDDRYNRQVRNYMYLLQQMGYEEVLGYLWYVETGNIENIEL